jgi:hypothetical protein
VKMLSAEWTCECAAVGQNRKFKIRVHKILTVPSICSYSIHIPLI